MEDAGSKADWSPLVVSPQRTHQREMSESTDIED